tara:strand:+ start:61 stop:885 length:825 start_codon:yes stop_codon:yes gene_type:complete
MEIILSNYDFSYDPVTAVSEDQATGKIAEIFLDIKKTMQIPLITSIWRGLAGMNNSLEEIWILTKPIYLSGTPELALNHMLNSISFPIPTKFNSEKFNAEDLKHIKDIIKVYTKSNGMNLMALSAFIKSEYKPRVVISNITPKIVQASFPRLLNKEEISNKNWEIVKKVNSLGGIKNKDNHVATLWRHLSYWPNFLDKAYENIKIFESNGDLMKTQNDVLNYIENNGINLKRQKDKYTNINISTLNTIKNYVRTTNQVIRMVVLGQIMLKWLEK